LQHISESLSVLAISDCFTDFLVYSDIQRVAIFIGNNFIFGRNMPLPTEEQRTAAVVAQANRSISPPLRRSRTPTGIQKNRKTATNHKRRELRRWWANDLYRKRDHKDAIAWFQQNFQRSLSTFTVSDYLSKKYVYLDDQELSKYVLSSNRNRSPEHKELEKALAEWQLRYDRHPDSGLTTRELLVLKAKEF
jgi:hypothetical protein